MSPDVIDVAIIGAGPYGLSIASHLGARGIDYRIFGSPMHTWTECMPEGMLLRSEGFASNLSHPSGKFTLEEFSAERGLSVGGWAQPVPLSVYCDYGRWFVERAALLIEDSRLELVTRMNDDFALGFSHRETVCARRVILAIGLTHFSHMPEELAELPGELLSHSSERLKFRDFAGRDVIVLGAGQSALETAALLHEHDATVRVVGRRAAVKWNPDPPPRERPLAQRLRAPVAGLGIGWSSWLFEAFPGAFRRLPESKRLDIVARTFGPAGAWWLRDRVEGRFPLDLGRTLRSARERHGRAELELLGPDGPEIASAEHVIAGTGYRINLGRISFLGDEIRGAVSTEGTSPALSSGFESSVPGLYFAGASAATGFGPVMRFVLGAEFAARTIARHVGRPSTRRGGSR